MSEGKVKWIKAVAHCSCGGAITIDGPNWKQIDPILDAFNRLHPTGDEHQPARNNEAARARAKAKR